MKMKNEQNKIIDYFRAEDGFTILPHINPDGDAFGSGSALFLVLKALNKQVQFVVEEPIPFMYRTMPLAPCLTRPEEAKKYPNVICVDISDPGRLECPEMMQGCKTTIVIDHHISNQGFGDLQWIEPKAAATAEVVFQIAERLQVPLKGDLATCLLLALSTDTGHFGFRNTTPRTLQMAAQLLENGASISDICYDVYHRKTLSKTKLLGRAIDSLQLFCDGKVGLVSITKQDLLECGCDQSDCEGLVDVAREIDGVEISVLLREKEDAIKGSLRSRNEINVADLAAQYGGGGHRAASGFTLQMTLEQAIDEIKQMLERTMNGR